VIVGGRIFWILVEMVIQAPRNTDIDNPTRIVPFLAITTLNFLITTEICAMTFETKS